MFAVNDGFLGHIPEELRKHHEVRMFDFQNDEKKDFNNLCDMLPWCEVAFFDFLHWPFPKATQLNLGCKIVGRLHGLELYHYMKDIKWENVDHLICSPPQLSRMKFYNFTPPCPTTVLPVGTDLEVFKYAKKRFGRKLCMVNYVFPRKRIYTTIEAVAPFLEDGWSLHIRGSISPDWRTVISYEEAMFINELIYTLRLKKDQIVVYPKRLSDTELADWFSDKDIIINNSTQEGYGKATIDAVACGVYPLVHNWLGASDLYPPQYLFSSQCELQGKIEWWNDHGEDEKRSLSLEARTFAENHDERNVAQKIREIIEAV